MSDTSKKFNFSVCADLSLSVEEIWPEGDAPEEPTVDDVIAIIKRCGGKDRVLVDWNLMDEVDLTVSDGQDSKEVR